jgi:hypothetical protein
MREWLKIAMRRDIVLRGLQVAALVGTVLVAINQGDLIVSGRLDASAAWKIPLTYLVPYCVATYGGVSAIRASDKSQSREQGLTGDQ